jgi:hypothetical protein
MPYGVLRQSHPSGAGLHPARRATTRGRREDTGLSLPHLKAAVAAGDRETLIRYVRLHVGDGDEDTGRREIDKAWSEALTVLLDLPDVDRAFVLETLQTKDRATLAHLFFSLHFHLVHQSGEWIHDGDL